MKDSEKKCPRCNGTGVVPKKTRYSIGRSYEYIVKSKLEQKGYYVTRSYGSKGIFDLMATKKDIILGIQVKALSGKHPEYLTSEDTTKLNEFKKSNTRTFIQTSYAGTPFSFKKIIFEGDIKIIHAYKDGQFTKYRELINVGEWNEFKP